MRVVRSGHCAVKLPEGETTQVSVPKLCPPEPGRRLRAPADRHSRIGPLRARRAGLVSENAVGQGKRSRLEFLPFQSFCNLDDTE